MEANYEAQRWAEEKALRDPHQVMYSGVYIVLNWS